MIKDLFTNDLFLSCLISGIIAQMIKYIIQAIKTKKLN
ncbi:putative membrane spanning protein [Borrelia duttonii CR2A]|uniref:Membrane spanning protein n=2 Tax=Borrelia TaxID=138 RepID=W5SLZ9_9SPIR|nr:Putative membrane spanning protein [Borrelia crocidurae DOU]ETZ18114.1 putative membrane spanning protein [Borrelia duttonii CR2A]